MSETSSLTRNTIENFAQRVRKNLEFIIKKRAEGEDVHEVTQLAISLLGIIVFPVADGASESFKELSLSQLEKEGWPHWEITLDKKGDTKTLGKLVWHLRNAASHRRIWFSLDDPDMEKVEIKFEDAPRADDPPNWCAKIRAADLKTFCDRFTMELEDYVG